MHGTSGPGIIAIDGPAGSGKSTIGEQLARTLGYLYIDTGATYRAVSWLALQKGIDLHNGPALARLAEETEVVIERPTVADGRQYTVKIDGRDITWDIRNTSVTRYVSTVSTHPEVRAVLRQWQRRMAQQGYVVMVGRDIGAIVLPNADLKIYLTASLEERARRRYAELVARMGGNDSALPSLQSLMTDIHRRDDEDRENMQPAPDAVVIETDGLSIEQVLAVIFTYVEK
jgi:cytidylate kinase